MLYISVDIKNCHDLARCVQINRHCDRVFYINFVLAHPLYTPVYITLTLLHTLTYLKHFHDKIYRCLACLLLENATKSATHGSGKNQNRVRNIWLRCIKIVERRKVKQHSMSVNSEWNRKWETRTRAHKTQWIILLSEIGDFSWA